MVRLAPVVGYFCPARRCRCHKNELLSNGNTTGSVTLQQTEPLSGSQSLHFAFEFGNEDDAWGQWTLYRVPLAQAPKDLTALSGVRLKARSNETRTVRLDLTSPEDSANNEGIHFGWDLNVPAETKSFEVLFEVARIPSWASDPGDELGDILAAVSGISLQPKCNGRDDSGQLPEGTSDDGGVEIDDIESF